MIRLTTAYLHTYQLGGVALEWFRSYLVGRRQHVRTSSSSSTPAFIMCGVPQGSVLGPILFLLCTAVTSAPSIAVFRSRLKTHLFNISYTSPLWLYSAWAVAFDTIIVLAYFYFCHNGCCLAYVRSLACLQRVEYPTVQITQCHNSQC